MLRLCDTTRRLLSVSPVRHDVRLLPERHGLVDTGAIRHMNVVRGRADTPAADQAVTNELIQETAESGESVLRVWRPHRTVAFGRRDANRDGYDDAREIALEQGFTPIERTVGGHAVAFSGNTVAFLLTTAVDQPRKEIQSRYDDVKASISAACNDLGVTVEAGEPDGSFCPGCHSLSAAGKIVGLAQRVRRDVAVVSGVVLVADHEAIAGVLEPTYNALDIDFDPESVGSIARAGGESSPTAVMDAIESQLSSS